MCFEKKGYTKAQEDEIKLSLRLKCMRILFIIVNSLLIPIALGYLFYGLYLMYYTQWMILFTNSVPIILISLFIYILIIAIIGYISSCQYQHKLQILYIILSLLSLIIQIGSVYIYFRIILKIDGYYEHNYQYKSIDDIHAINESFKCYGYYYDSTNINKNMEICSQSIKTFFRTQKRLIRTPLFIIISVQIVILFISLVLKHLIKHDYNDELYRIQGRKNNETIANEGAIYTKRNRIKVKDNSSRNIIQLTQNDDDDDSKTKDITPVNDDDSDGSNNDITNNNNGMYISVDVSPQHYKRNSGTPQYVNCD